MMADTPLRHFHFLLPPRCQMLYDALIDAAIRFAAIGSRPSRAEMPPRQLFRDDFRD